MARWQVQEAKMRLSQVIEEAQVKGPQVIMRHGVDRAVVLSIDDFRSLTAHKPDLRAWLLGTIMHLTQKDSSGTLEK